MCGEKKGRFRPAGGEIFFWVSNRVPRVIYTRYAVPDLEAHVASSSAEEAIFFHTNVAHSTTFV